MQIQISWLLQKPTDLDLHCLQRQGISGFSRTRVNKFFCFQLMSNNQRYAQFLFHLSDLGCSLQVSKLRDTARTVLKLMPADAHTVDRFRTVCSEHVRSGAAGVSTPLDAMFFNSSPTQVLYNIEVREFLIEQTCKQQRPKSAYPG